MLLNKKVAIVETAGEYNPLEESGIICLNRNNTSDTEISERLKELDFKGYFFKRVYVYEHSGRIFSQYPFSDQWYSRLYGVFAFPNEMAENLSEEDYDRFYEQYTQWAEGEVYDIFITNSDSELNVKFAYDLLLKNIDIFKLFEYRNYELMEFIKNSNLSLLNFEEDFFNGKYEPFLSKYSGRNAFGLIENKEIGDSILIEGVFGLENVEKILKEEL